MYKNEMKKIEKMLDEFDFDYSFNEENQKYLLSKKNYNELIEFLNDNEEERKNINIDDFEIKTQIHIPRDRDIKIDMKKIENYNIKLIYHRKKDNSKEYRLYISFKDEENNLRRIRMVNNSIKSIHNDEDKMIEYFEKINKNQVEKYLKEEKIS